MQESFRHRTALLWALSIFIIPLWNNALADAEELADFFSDDNLLIVDLRLNNRVLAEDVFVYNNTEISLVPLQALFDALEFPIFVDYVEGTAQGWFLSPSNTFELNLQNNDIAISGNRSSLTSDQRVISDGFDLYVEIETLESWFPISLTLQISQLRLLLESEEELPIEKRLAREQARLKLDRLNSEKTMLVADSYSLVGPPVVDVNATSRVQDRNNGALDRSADLSYFVQGNMDLLKMQSNFSFVRAGLNEQSTGRLKFLKKRSHPDQPLLGDLNAFEFGDIFSVSDPLIFNSGSGLGIDLEYGKERDLSDFGKQIIEGQANPGWEVEVYRNNALIDFQTVGEDGRYLFEDLPLEYGENIFEVRLFGPQGQESTRREAITVGAQSLPIGQSYARLHFSNLNQSVFTNAPSFSGSDQTDNSEQIGYFTFAHGISNALSLQVTAAEHGNPIFGEANRNYFGVGLDTALPRIALGAQRLSQLGEGHAHIWGLQTRLRGTSVSYSHKLYDNFSSDRSEDGRLHQDAELRLSSFYGGRKNAPVTHQLITDFEETADRTKNWRIENRLGFNLYKGRLSWDHTYLDNPGSNVQQGSFRYLRATGVNLNLRGSLLYRADDNYEFTSLNANANWNPDPSWNLQVTFNADLVGDDNNAIAIGSSWDFRTARLSTNASLTEGGGGFISMSIDFSLQKQPREWSMTSEKISNYGQLQTQVFLDSNRDGLYDQHDKAMSGVSFEGVNKWKNKATDNRGELVLTNLRGSTPTPVKLDQGSLEDPFWQPLFQEARFISHPGGINYLQVPVTETIEIEGSILLGTLPYDKNTAKEVPGVPVQLLDSTGEIVAETVSEFDGYYLFNSILPGQYTLQIQKEAIARLGVASVEPVSINAREGVIYLDPIIVFDK